MNTKPRIIQIGLLGIGLTVWLVTGGVLKKRGDFDFQPNVMHLKGSPYGRTLALAMRGPADVFWHRGEVHDDCGSECGQEGCEHDHSGCDHEAGGCEHEECEHEGCDHGEDPLPGGDSASELAAMAGRLSEEHAEHEAAEHGEHEDDPAAQEFTGVRDFLLDTIADMRKARHSRNNPRGEGRMHRAYVMGETQRRLALGFQMDPTNIACYGSYFMFLAEALARVEGEQGEEAVIRARRKAAMDLAKYTFGYCLNYQDEAPAMVTAATAAHDYLQIQMTGPDPSLAEFAEMLRILDGTIGRYEAIRAQMIEDGTWESFYIHRREEMEKAYSLVRVLRDADHTMYDRLKDSSVLAPVPQSGTVTR